MGPSPASPMDFWSTATPAASSPAATPWATGSSRRSEPYKTSARTSRSLPVIGPTAEPRRLRRSEEHTSELQSRENLVCRLLLEKKKTVEDVVCGSGAPK